MNIHITSHKHVDIQHTNSDLDLDINQSYFNNSS